jgi:hypothetical protein
VTISEYLLLYVFVTFCPFFFFPSFLFLFASGLFGSLCRVTHRPPPFPESFGTICT